jgi:hypothetical protein
MRWLALLGVVGLAACVDDPLAHDPPLPRVIASWDPLACTTRDRVEVALAGEAGAVSASAPCPLGSLVLDVPALGRYEGRAGGREVELLVDQPIVELEVAP